METNFSDQINYILDSIKYVPPQTLNIKEDSLSIDLSPDNKQVMHELSRKLAGMIYQHHYCKGTNPQSFDTNNPIPELARKESQKYLKQLRKANQSREGFDRGWKVQSVDRNGSVLAQKWNFIRRIMPGEFIRENFNSQHYGDSIKIWNRKGWVEPNNIFYYVFGTAKGDGEGMNLIRIYFNISPEGSKTLIEELSTRFNKYRIPFHFKCPHNPAFYNRADSAVLYLDKRYANFAFKVLREFYEVLSPVLRKGIPLFCKKLNDGIAFAENPPNSGESFGVSRCSLIAYGILNAIDRQIPKKDWLPTVLQTIEENNLLVDKFYLNPKASFPYQFIPFKNEQTSNK